MSNENLDLQEQLELISLHRREVETLYAISQILTIGAHQRQALAEIMALLSRELGLYRGTVTLLSPDGNEIKIELAHNLSQTQSRKVRFRMGEGVTGKVMQSGRAIVVPKVSEEPLFLNRFERWSATEEEISFICVPISIGPRVIGTISVDRPFDATARLNDDKRILSIVSSMVANDVEARRDTAIMRQRLEDENLRLRHDLEDRFRPENILGNSSAMHEVYRQIHQVADSNATVVLRGESGTGKELVANAIHYSSTRANRPMIKVNCAALNENLLESELFGHEKGAFTGAVQNRKGRIEEAADGTLFLDEIGDFSPIAQVKLLRVLQEHEFERVGSNRTLKTNARVIVATNCDLEQNVADGKFRQDLYYRINVFPIMLPPLRQRKDDIVLLINFFVDLYSKRMNKKILRVNTPAINMMSSYHWPGNVRELENCIERAILLCDDGIIHSHHLPATLQNSDASGAIGVGSLKERTSLFERDLIIDVLKRCNGNLAATARALKTTARIIQYKVKELGIDHKRYHKKKDG